ncbi:65kDa B protein-domain-containing protein [Nemania sp. NC0429]|nr:65kDa B protein-domain-containing protein [Nemania sp. NC0429]
MAPQQPWYSNARSTEGENGEGGEPGPPPHALQNHTNPVVSAKESAAVNASTGALSVSVPVYTSPGRSGFGPSLALSYSSSRENGTFGLGWGLNTESITRKTSKQLPRYRDDESDADVFLLSDVDDLVPTPVKDEVLQDGWKIRRYNPRIISKDVRIERFNPVSSSETDVYWRVISADNVTTIFGRTDESRIFEPAGQTNGNQKRIFAWLISDRFDAHGNAMHFKYKAEDGAGVDVENHIYEEHRSSPFSQRYLKGILYGNRVPNRRLTDWVVDPTLIPDNGWMFEVVLDYGDHDPTTPTTQETAQWPVRRDPFSVHSSGFEVRTYRLCQRILMFHHIPEEFNGVQDVLVSSTVCGYDESALPNGIPLLVSVTTNGHTPGLQTESLAPSSFEYTPSQPPQPPMLMDADCPSLQPVVAGLVTGDTEWIDFNGEGLSGWLTRYDDAWYYQRNKSPLALHQGCCFEDPELVSRIPSLAKGSSFFTDLNLRGKPGLVCGAGSDKSQNDGPPGYYDRREDGGWSTFAPFSSSPNIDLRDIRLRMVDLTGDGRADILRLTGDTRPGEWYPSLADKGFAELSGVTVSGVHRPALRVGDPESYIYMADMTGDGLADIVHIQNGVVIYWPSQGYGKFGASVTMGNAPHIKDFTHERLRLANVTGSGMTDLIYLPPGGGVWIYHNRAGNQWSNAQILPLFPELDSVASVMVIDLFGRGTACLCWVSPGFTAPTIGAKGLLQYIDLVGGPKPGLLKTRRNGFGLEDLVEYSPSAKFYLEDERLGRPWTTCFPFPVHCAESITTIDRITGSTATTRYAYHDGYYDMFERESRGFGMVEQWHTEAFPAAIDSNRKGFAGPTTYKKSWFHLGRLPGIDHLPTDRLLGNSDVNYLTSDAYRALKGLPIREEVYSNDDSKPQILSYLLQENRYEVKAHQVPDSRGQGVYRIISREKIKSHSDNSDDPRLLHEILLDVDEYGHATKATSIAYGKKKSTLEDPTDRLKQEETVILYTEARYTNAIDSTDSFRLPEIYETANYRVSPGTHRGLFDYSQLIADEYAFFRCAKEVDIEDADMMKDGIKALIAKDCVLYRSSDLSSRLPSGKLEIYSEVDQTFQLAITPRNLSGPLAGFIPADYKVFLEEQGGYVDLNNDNHWWIPSQQVRYAATSDPTVELKGARAGFYIPTVHVDPFGIQTHSELDTYKLFVTQTVDGMQNSSSSLYDYVALQPKLSTDPNGNQTATVFDALRRAVGGAVSGKVGQGIGDSLEGFRTQLTTDEIKSFLKDPEGPITRDILSKAGHRIIYVNAQCLEGVWTPGFQVAITRDEHASTNATAQLGIDMIYFNGSRGPAQGTALESHQKWRCSGLTLCDSKGLPVRQYLAFFSKSHTYQPQPTPISGPSLSTTIFRDGLDREIGNLQADHTWSKIRLMPWLTENFDAGDMVLTSDPATDPDMATWFKSLDEESYMPSWYDRAIQSADQQERDAARKSTTYSRTPDVTHLDSLGRTIIAVQDNGTKGKYTTRTDFNLLGHVSRVTNARGILVTKAYFDMGGRELLRWNADSGESRSLVNCLGQPILMKNGQTTKIRYSYDAIRRLKAEWLVVEQSEILVSKFVFGESQSEASERNLRTQVYQRYDQAGLLQNNRFDFKGNCVCSQTQLAEDYKGLLDWTGGNTPLPLLESTVFPYKAMYNARNQACTTTAADGSQTSRTYNVCGELQTLSFNHYATDHSAVYISDTVYTPDKKRESVVYGNGSQKRSNFEAASRRLKQSQVQRNDRNNTILRDISYTYDCCGQTSNLFDAAPQTTYFRNTVVKPMQDFTYDALSRIVEARGRERIDVSNAKSMMLPYSPSDPATQNPGNGSEMCEYLENYEYDSVGNILLLSHKPAKDVSVSGWKREYSYNSENDQISSTKVGGTTESYGYNEQGCISYLRPYYTSLSWDFHNRLRFSSTQIVKQGTPETTFYVYDSRGRRVRKVTERATSEGGSSTPTKLKETIYLACYQIYRTFNGDGQSIKRETQTSTVVEDSENEYTAAALIEYEPTTKATVIRYQTTETLELDDQAGVVSYGEYSPFGVNTYNAIGTAIEAPRKYRFAKYERDSETGLYHCGERYYAAWLGRWSSPDPIGLAGGINRYCYVNNCPTSLSDHNGMMPRRTSRAGGASGQDQNQGESSNLRKRSVGLGEALGPEEAGIYVTTRVNRRATIKAFDGHLTSSVVLRQFRKRPAAVGIQGLEGCTALVVASPKAVYFAHFFEDQGFVKPATEEGQEELTDEQVDAQFQERVIDRLNSGKKARWKGDDEAFTSLTKAKKYLTGPDTHAAIITPRDHPEDEPVLPNQGAYQTKVNQIKDTVNNLLNITNERWHQRLYEGKGGEADDGDSKGAGRALVEFDPRTGPGTSTQGNQPRVRLYMENQMMFEI